jgi:hypothetical protein
MKGSQSLCHKRSVFPTAHRGFHLSLEVFGQIAHNVFDLVVATALHRVPAAEHRVDGRPQCLRAMLRTSKYRNQSLNTS